MCLKRFHTTEYKSNNTRKPHKWNIKQNKSNRAHHLSRHGCLHSAFSSNPVPASQRTSPRRRRPAPCGPSPRWASAMPRWSPRPPPVMVPPSVFGVGVWALSYFAWAIPVFLQLNQLSVVLLIVNVGAVLTQTTPWGVGGSWAAPPLPRRPNFLGVRRRAGWVGWGTPSSSVL